LNHFTVPVAIASSLLRVSQAHVGRACPPVQSVAPLA
jgi:hypothetical protein